MICAEIALTIPFHDVDALEIVWHGHYVRYLELARCAVLKLIDYDYQRMRESGYSWPVIDLKVRYPRPARFDQRVLVRAELVEWKIACVSAMKSSTPRLGSATLRPPRLR